MVVVGRGVGGMAMAATMGGGVEGAKRTTVDPFVNSRWRRGFFHCGESYVEPRDGYLVSIPRGAEAAGVAAPVAAEPGVGAGAVGEVQEGAVRAPAKIALPPMPGGVPPRGGNIDMSSAQIYGNHPLIPMGRGLGNGAVTIGSIPGPAPFVTKSMGGLRSVGSVPSLQVIAENAGPGEDLPGTLKVYTSTARHAPCKILPKVGSLVDLANIGLLKDSNLSPAHNRRKPHALVVDDTQTSRMVLAKMLQKLGYLVTEVEDGAEAVETMKAVTKGKYQNVDIVFMDIVMPGMSGHVAVAEIRKLGGIAATVPVVAVTATDPGSLADFDHVSKAGLRSGMSAIIAKPVNFKLVSDALSKHTPLRPAVLPNREFMVAPTTG